MVATERVKYNPNQIGYEPQSTRDIPLVKTETRTVTYTGGGGEFDLGELVSAQSHETNSQTIETTTVRPWHSPHRLLLLSFLLTNNTTNAGFNICSVFFLCAMQRFFAFVYITPPRFHLTCRFKTCVLSLSLTGTYLQMIILYILCIVLW